MTHPTEMTPDELREWHQHIRTAILAGTDWEDAHHRADRFIEMGRERQGGSASEPAPYDPGPLPAWAEPLPKGAVYAGRGSYRLREFAKFRGLVLNYQSPRWAEGWCDGSNVDTLYAVPADSPVARALGLGGAK